MAYIKLGKTNINYYISNNIAPEFILSQVINSKCSSVYPKLVSSIEELELYFGNSFPEFKFFSRLFYENPYLNLYLYKPINNSINKVNNNINLSDYVEYVNYDSFGNNIGFYNVSDLPDHTIVESYDRNTDWKFYVINERSYYIWNEELNDYVDSLLIPEEDDFTDSKYNRDSLRITTTDSKISYCHPEYSNLYRKVVYSEDIENLNFKNNLDESLLENEKYSLVYDLDFSEVSNYENVYLVLPLNNKKIQIYSGVSKLGSDVITNPEINTKEFDSTLGVSDIIRCLREFGFKVKINSKTNISFYSDFLIKDIQFFEFPGLKMTKNLQLSHNIYSILTENQVKVEMFSKTIGPGDSDITVTIEKILEKELENNEYYRFIINRYSYEEIFEGYLNPVYNESTNIFESLEKKINQNSKLIEIRFNFSKKDESLREGTWTLKRAVLEQPTNNGYINSLEILKGSNIKEDFLLIPDIFCYYSESLEKTYKSILTYCEEKNSQALIINNSFNFFGTKYLETDHIPDPPDKETLYHVIYNDLDFYYGYSNYFKSWEKIDTENLKNWNDFKELLIVSDNNITWRNNYFLNYIEKNNRLVYFYNNLKLFDNEIPGYYLFIRGILTGIYSLSPEYLEYDSPYENAYYDGTDIYEKYKSNYLVYNNHKYYYKKFFSHPGDWKYNATILSRFIENKVSNTLERTLKSYLGNTQSVDIIYGINNKISHLISHYPIIYSLKLKNIEENIIKNSLSIDVELKTKELVDKDIQLNITLNLNN